VMSIASFSTRSNAAPAAPAAFFFTLQISNISHSPCSINITNATYQKSYMVTLLPGSSTSIPSFSPGDIVGGIHFPSSGLRLIRFGNYVTSSTGESVGFSFNLPTPPGSGGSPFGDLVSMNISGD
jgi:hypothetical protein